MEAPYTIRKGLLFCLGLLALIPVCLVLWGLLLPYYGTALATVALPGVRACSDLPVEGVGLEPQGLFNTGSRLVFHVGERRPALNVGALVFNVPPFVALMLLTPGLRWRRRLGSIVAGTAILAAGHIVYIVVVFLNAPRIARSPEIPTALGELFLALPFLLWILFGYWRRLTSFLARPAA